MSDPRRPSNERKVDNRPRDAGADSDAEFDLPYIAGTHRRPRPDQTASGAIRAFLFLTAAYVVGAGGGQFVGLAIGAALLGKRLPFQARALVVWQEAVYSLTQEPTVVFCIGAASLLLTMLITLAFVRGWDRRPLRSVGLQLDDRSARQLGAGFLLGAALIALIFAVEAGFGWLRVAGALPFPAAVAHAAVWFLALLPAAAAEEIMLRGYTFQALEEEWGSLRALLLTALIFGALHGINPSAGWASFSGIAVSGVLFGMAFLVTRRLWLPIGLHAAWNVFEGPVLGFPVSGLDFPSALTIHVTGPTAWTGGSFGPEAGLLGVLASIAGVAILLAARRRA